MREISAEEATAVGGAIRTNYDSTLADATRILI